jgi:TrmH family RNA methyltransferase
MNEMISSAQNAKIKLIRSLSDKKGRSESGLFVAEGINLIKDMQDKSASLFVRAGVAEKHKHLLENWTGETTLVADKVFDGISETVSSGGVLAVVPIPKSKPLSGRIVLLLDGISDPGNLGTILRTACALGVYDIIGAECADFYNPKTVRASMGGIFLANLLEAKREELPDLLRDYTVAALDMSGADVYGFVPPARLALAVGNEAHGVSKTVSAISSYTLAVPMYGGGIESLNAAVSVSIALSAITHRIYQ